jgi:ABC-type glycerol-3-phosphate transport system permease component
MPLQILLLTGFLANQPRELEDAARMDGATERQILQYIVVPLAAPAAVVISQIPLVLLFLLAHRWLARRIYAGALR